MADTDEITSDIATLMIRVVLGTLYVSHPLLMWAIFGLEHAPHYAYVIAAGELLGGVMLLAGLCIRQVSVALLPIAIGTALLHFETGVGMNLAYGAYLAGCLAGQALLAGGALGRRHATDHDDAALGPT